MEPETHFAPALQSPAFVGAKDRDGWVGLFHDDGFVEDPVEAGRYQGTTKIETFWDVFIGPQPSVRFEVDRDYWGGDTLMRQATVVNITQAHPTETLRVPALICYTLREGKVGSLQAVWEPQKVIAWFVGRGLSGLAALSKHSVRMLSGAGLGNGMAFGGTLVGGIGHGRGRTIIEAIRNGDPTQWAERLGGATITVAQEAEAQTFESDAAAALACIQSYVDSISQLAVSQFIVCGNHLAAFLNDDKGERGLALMLQVDGHGRVQTMRAIASQAPRVLGPRD